MDKRTLIFHSLIDLAGFSRQVSTGYVMNTNNFTLTGKFTKEEVAMATGKFNAQLIKTTDKVFSYGS